MEGKAEISIGKSTKYRSSNCSVDQVPTSMFTFIGHNKANEAQDYQSFIVSCQDHTFDTPDAATISKMKEITSNAIQKEFKEDVVAENIVIEAHGIPLGNQGIKSAASEVSKRRMASNCGPNYDLNKVTAYNKFTCRYLGKGLDDKGRLVQNPFQTWKGTLASCDSTIHISDTTESDIRKLAWDAAGGDEAKLDVDQFVCSIHSIPLN